MTWTSFRRWCTWLSRVEATEPVISQGGRAVQVSSRMVSQGSCCENEARVMRGHVSLGSPRTSKCRCFLARDCQLESALWSGRVGSQDGFCVFYGGISLLGWGYRACSANVAEVQVLHCTGLSACLSAGALRGNVLPFSSETGYKRSGVIRQIGHSRSRRARTPTSRPESFHPVMQHDRG